MEKKLSAQREESVPRKIGAATATSIVIANMVGSGIFTASGIIAGLLPGPILVLLCWLSGGIIAVTGALCYAELSTRMPEVGGEYLYLKRLYHPCLGFLTGWTSLVVGFSAPIAAAAMGFSEYLFAAIGAESLSAGPLTSIFFKKAASLLVIFIFTSVHYRGLERGSAVQNTLTAVKIFIVMGLALAGILLGRGDLSNLFASEGTFRWTSIGTAMILVMFSYSGWNATAYIAGELKQPRRALRQSLLSGTIAVVILYLAINVFIFHSLPFRDTMGVIAIVEKASSGAFGMPMGKGLSLMVATALLSSLSAYILIGPRIYFAMAKDRLFLPFAAGLHPRFKVPSKSIAVQSALACVMVLAGSFEQLLVYLGFALSIFPWLAVAGIFIARRRRIGEATAARVPLYPFTPLFFLACTLALMGAAYINRPVESTAAVMTIIAGIPCYFLWVRKIGKTKPIR